MKILVVNYRDRKHPAAGGAEKHLHRIFSRIVGMGHQVVLLTTAFAGAQEREIVDGIQVVRKGGDLLFQLTVAKNLKALDREFHFDVVVEDLNKLPVFTPQLTKKPVLVQMHHLWRKSIFAEACFPVAFGVWLFETIIPWFYKCKNFVVVSPSTKQELSALGIPEKQIEVIYNGSDDLSQTASGAEAALRAETAPGTALRAETAPGTAQTVPTPYFLWLSRVHKYKGIWTALEAFEIFAKSHPDVKLKIAGDGPLLKKIPAWLNARGLSERVMLCGFVSLEKKQSLLAGAVALLQTSYKEGWGLTVMEAAAHQVPSIASDVPGLRDSVRNGETGVLFPAGDANACAAAMSKVYEDSALQKSLGEAAANYAKSFSWETATDQTLKLLEQVVAEAKAGM